jgi:phosphatidylserine/phosphatidylglycerophosphate/cardiolipin synthase-like enzyme
MFMGFIIISNSSQRWFPSLRAFCTVFHQKDDKFNDDRLDSADTHATGHRRKLYLFTATAGPTRRMHKRVRGSRCVSPEGQAPAEFLMEALKKAERAGIRDSDMCIKTADSPCSKHRCEILTLGEDMFVDMLPALRSAKKYIFIEYFFSKTEKCGFDPFNTSGKGQRRGGS